MNCKQAHEKIKMAERTNITEIKDSGNSISKINLTNIPCKYHSGQSCCLFCNSCDRVVCTTCIARSHKSHEFIDIDKAYNMKKEILIRKGEAVYRQLEKSKMKKHKIVEWKDQKRRKLIITRQAISEHEKALKAEVERLTKALLQNLEQSDAKINKQYEKDEKALIRFSSKTQGKIQDKDNLLTTTNGAEFFKKINGMIKSLDETPKPQTSPTYTEIKFVPQGLTSVGEIQTEKVSVPLDKGIFGMSIKKEITTKFKTISTLLPYRDNKLLLSSYWDEVLQNIELIDDTFRILSTTKSIFVNELKASEEDILIVNEIFCRLQLYNVKSNKISDSPFDISPLRPNTIHVTERNQIIIGAFNADYPKQGRRAVIIMDRSGKRVATYERYGNNKPIFAMPISITTTANGNIMVSDHDYENEEEGRVIVLDNKGKFVNRYTGHRDINKKEPFEPKDIVTTSEDTVIVADFDTHYLHVLDNHGRLLTVFNLEDKGITLPMSLVFTDSKHLYIGCGTYADDEKREAKLFKVELS